MTPDYTRIWEEGTRKVVVALSGGGDSLALLHLMLEQGEQVEAAHLDHSLRRESADESNWLANVCQGLSVPYHGRRVDVERLARRWGCGVEAAGRRARYSWLKSLSHKLGALICTAHTRDDQAETLLMRLVQGCTATGMRGILEQMPMGAPDPWLYRPLLRCDREQLRDFLRQRELSWLEDPMNRDTQHLRPWVRHRLIPLMKERNPRLEESLCRLAASASGEDYREIAELWRAADPQARMTRRHLAWLADLKVGQQCSLPGGLLATRERAGLKFSSAVPKPIAVVPVPACLPLQGTVILSEWRLRIEIGPNPGLGGAAPNRILLDRDVEQPLWIRGRTDGDRFGRAKLKKTLNAAKIAPEVRDSWPLLTDARGRILWIVGRRARAEALTERADGLAISIEPINLG